MWERMVGALRHFRVALVAAIVTFSLVIGGVVWWDRSQPVSVSVAPSVVGSTVVYIDGAVATPGLVSLESPARLLHAIEAAGGLGEHADVTALNLAGRVNDGERVSIPQRAPEPAAPVSGAGEEAALASAAEELTNLNTASTSDLEALPGIGPARASAIVEHRDRYGPFTSVNQLFEIDGLPGSVADEILDLVTTGE